jgi:uncharacterized NAD(P)/FAD-binding protein YdhS
MTDEMQKARRKLEVIIADSAPYDPLLHDHEVEALDALIAAVRAETLREVRGIIADVKAGGDDFADNADEKFGWDQACDCVHNSLALKDTLTALAHPEGTDK